MDVNYIRLAFIFNAVFIGFFGTVIHFFEPILPISLIQTFRYGKFSCKIKNNIISNFEVPKRWFQHFYNLAAPLSSFTFVLVVRKYFFNYDIPDSIKDTLDLLMGTTRNHSVSAAHTLIATGIFMVHCNKRFYECHYINVFSNAKMNISAYIVGFIHYFGCVASMIGESAGFVTGSKIEQVNWSDLSFLDSLAALVLLISSLLQYKTNMILANLRKDKNGIVVTKEYKIPTGGLFEYVSAPLQLTEIIIYLCLSIILRNSHTFHFVLIWVIANQVTTAKFSHEWSVKTFINYPKSRKVLIPFIF